jgi:hypothetical protein
MMRRQHERIDSPKRPASRIAVLAALLLSLAAPGWAQADEESTGAELRSTLDEESVLDRIRMSYFGIFYGPGFANSSRYQPRPDGRPDPDRPVVLKNYLSLGYGITDSINFGGAFYWLWQPIPGEQLVVKDPYVKLSHNSIISTDRFNLYGDIRMHFGMSNLSRENDLLTGLQHFQIATYTVGDWTAGFYGSVRVNFFGRQGYGDDLQLYGAPNLSYQITPTLGVQALYEMASSHFYGDRPGYITSDGTDLELGMNWDATPNLLVNPYVRMYPENVSWESTSAGMFLSWRLM